MRLFQRSVKEKQLAAFGVHGPLLSKVIGIGMVPSRSPGRKFLHDTLFWSVDYILWNGCEYTTRIGESIIKEAMSFKNGEFDNGWMLKLKKVVHIESICNIIPESILTERLCDLSDAQIKEEARRIQSNRSSMQRIKDQARLDSKILTKPTSCSESIFSRFRIQAEYQNSFDPTSEEYPLPPNRLKGLFSLSNPEYDNSSSTT